MTPPSGSEPASTGPPDRQTFQILEEIVANEPIVASTEFKPDSYEPQILRVLCDDHRYPPTIEAAKLDVRWFTSGDFSIHYVEAMAADHWECRWDRHLNPHNARLHFHQPSAGDDIVDLTWSSLHPIDVLSTVIAAIEHRIEQHWSTDGS